MMPTYDVTKVVEYTFTVEAESEEEAEDMAWEYDEQRELFRGKPHSCKDYAVYEIRVDEA